MSPVPHTYVDTTTAVIHFDVVARLRALGRPDDARSVRRCAYATLRQIQTLRCAPRGAVVHLRPLDVS